MDSIGHYETQGYLIVPGLVPQDELGQLTRELMLLQSEVESGRWRGNHLMENDGIARVIFNPYDHCPSLRGLVNRDDVVELAQRLLGTSVELDHSKLMCKPAHTGTEQPPHQDYFYWQGSKANQVACFVCVDECTEENGCLRVFPGSHRQGLLPHHEQRHEVTGERHWVCELDEEVRRNEQTFIGSPGDAIFFSSLTVHRSDRNRSAKHRRGVIFEFDEMGNLERRPGWGAPMPAAHWPLHEEWSRTA